MTITSTKAMLTAASLLIGLAACGGSSGGDNGTVVPGAGEIPQKFQIFPPMLYAGFDGTNTYKIPLQIFKNPGPVTVTIDDMSLVTIDSMNNDMTKITLKAIKAGSTMVHAMSGGQTVSAPLSIAMYTPEQNAAGKHRYTTPADNDNPACQDCHGAGKGPDHTPSEIDADPDQDVINTFLTGKDPEGRPVGEEFKAKLKGHTHMWKVTKEEETGLIAYLRSLTPTGYPEYDTATAGE
jgi:hypothetical protein